MTLILSIETSTKACSVALHKDQKLIGLKELFSDKSHSSLLSSLIRDLIGECGYNIKNLDAVAVSKGPGSYTGLRIGVSAAKGLCYALDIPLVSVNTLQSMAHGMIKYNFTGALLCPMLDARRMEVYCMVTDNNLKSYEETHALIIDDFSFSNLLNDYNMIFFGPGSVKVEKVLSNNIRAIFITDIFPSAAHIGSLAHDKLSLGEIENLAYFEPFYLKEFISKKPKPKF